MALFDPKVKAIAQLQKSIDEKNASINRYFDEIGRLYYGQYRDDTADVSKDINSRCDAITALLADIESNKTKILHEKGLKLCSGCRKENPLEHLYCSFCGMKFPDEESARQPEAPAAQAQPEAKPQPETENQAPEAAETESETKAGE